ncbi:MAG: hypothetical protein A2Z12_10235 [Actinobacteria bacterium RBG_16_68_21]|nr:MAG: hypothetical protein A2Z12_10235 [Actinobacteria bacterium RBG_16_68_21]
MTPQRPRRADHRTPLTRERVLDAAIALADERGIEALTMRSLGEALGVEAMSLYNHVANKDDLLDHMVDEVIGEFGVPASDADWKTALRASALSAHEVLLRHPWASRLLITRDNSLAPGRSRYMDSVLGALRNGGLSAELTHHAYHALDFHLLGFTVQEVSFAFDADELEQLAESVLRDLPAADYPHLVEHILGHLRSEFADRSGFEFGLDLILDGLEKLRETG